MRGTNKLDGPTVLLLGTGRSGTTWLSSLLAQPFRYRLLFEPFQPHQVVGSECIADRYYDPFDLPASVVSFCLRAINDKINSDWIAQSSNRRFRMHRWRFWPKVRICKDVRSNLFIPAYRSIFGPDLPIIVLMRHPGAVVESFLRVKFPWAFNVATLLDQSEFGRDYGIPLEKLRNYLSSDVGRLTLRWIIENAYLLEHAEELGVQILYYEKLTENPIAHIQRLAAELDLVVVSRLADLVSEPSYTTHPRSPLHSGKADGWKERLSEDQTNLIQSILLETGVRYPYE